MSVFGIDPGVSGAYALFDPSKSTESGLRWLVWDIEVIGTKHAEINATFLRDLIQRYSPSHAWLEQAVAMPSIEGRRTMGVAGAFRYGGMFYAIKAILASCNVPVSLVTPQAWKKHYKLSGSDKEQSRKRALDLFPEASTFITYKKDHGRAEAMLIAAYGSEQFARCKRCGGRLRVIDAGQLLLECERCGTKQNGQSNK